MTEIRDGDDYGPVDPHGRPLYQFAPRLEDYKAWWEQAVEDRDTARAEIEQLRQKIAGADMYLAEAVREASHGKTANGQFIDMQVSFARAALVGEEKP